MPSPLVYRSSCTDPTSAQTRTLSLHDALPIYTTQSQYGSGRTLSGGNTTFTVYRGTLNGEFIINAKLVPDSATAVNVVLRSEEHTSELQSHVKLVCRLLLEKKNKASAKSSSFR